MEKEIAKKAARLLQKIDFLEIKRNKLINAERLLPIKVLIRKEGREEDEDAIYPTTTEEKEIRQNIIKMYEDKIKEKEAELKNLI